MRSILIRPIITEKSMTLASRGWYTFEVDKESHRPEIAKAVESQFKVKVTGIRTITVKGKPQRTGKKRVEVKTSAWKKALVRLAKDQKIELFNFTQPETK